MIEVGYEQVVTLIMRDHYAHRVPTIQRAFSLMEDGEIVGCVTFGQPASPWVKVSMMGHDWDGEILELNRLVITTKTSNSASFLVGSAIRRLPKIPLVSYADKGAGHVGYVYQATNWKYAGESKERTDIFSDGGHARHHGGDSSKRQDRSAKHRYWTCRDSRLAKSVLWPSLPYPKGPTNRNHDQKKEDLPLFV